MTRLKAAICTISALAEADKAALWALYAAHYDAVDEARFRADLSEKDALVTLRDPAGALKGFSTYQLIDAADADGPARFLYSGDTIIDPAWWGRNDFAQAWLHQAGAIAARAPTPLYWLLIVKGHRTYRYLSVFAKTFTPRREGAPADLEALRDTIAALKFGPSFTRGLVRFSQSRGQLKPALAEIPAKDRARPEVAFFLAANPDYARGDELVCLCRLAPDNLQPIARRAFEAGAAEARDAASGRC